MGKIKFITFMVGKTVVFELSYTGFLSETTISTYTKLISESLDIETYEVSALKSDEPYSEKTKLVDERLVVEFKLNLIKEEVMN